MVRGTRRVEFEAPRVGGVIRLAVAAILLVSRALPLLLILGGTACGAAVLWRDALEDPRFRVEGETLSLSNRQGFCEEAVVEVERLGRLATGRSLLEPCLLTDLRSSYAASSWVKRVCSLKRVFPNRLAVEFVLRSPIAQVRSGSYYWTVDQDIVFLATLGTRQPREGLPMIVGTTLDAIGKPPQTPGEHWNDPGVRDAIGVIKTLRTSPLSESLRLERVLVHGGSFLDKLQRNIQKRPRIDVETTEKVTIRWGTFNQGEIPDEMSSAEKLAMLRNLVLRDFASIPGVSLDVRTRVPGFSLPAE